MAADGAGQFSCGHKAFGSGVAQGCCGCEAHPRSARQDCRCASWFAARGSRSGKTVRLLSHAARDCAAWAVSRGADCNLEEDAGSLRKI